MLTNHTSPKHSKIFHFDKLLTLLLLFSLLVGMPAASGLAQGPDSTLQEGPVVDPEEPRQTAGEMTPLAATSPTDSAGIAWGDPNGAHATYAWPFSVVQMGHAIQSFQNYGSTAGDSYFHHGIDMIAPNGTAVYTRSGGQVVNVENYTPGNALYWEVAILDPQGYVWQYHHIDNATIPQSIRDKFAEWQANHTTGGFIPANTYIGNIVYWTVTTFGYRFNHIHLNILAAGDVYLNTMEFHTPLNDTQAPEIQAIGLLKSNTVTAGNTVSGDYGLYVRARDLFLSTVFYLPPYKYEFSLDGGPWTTVWDFHTFPGGANDYTFVNDFFVYPPTCGNYTCRDFYADLGFTTSGQRPFPSTLGPHNIQVRVWDYNGNSASSSFSWTVYKSYENTTSASITDNGCASGTGVTKTFNVVDAILVSDVNVGLNLSHATRGQLKVTLKAPGDTAATTIVSNSTDAYDNYDVLIDDGSSSALNDGSNDTTASPYYDRTAGPNPNASLDSFSGKSALGAWTVFVCDNTGGTTGTVNRIKLDIAGATSTNNAPVANPQAASTDEDTPLALTLTGSDADSDPLTFSVTANPSHGVLSGTAPNLTYTPAANYFGADSFQFVANDGKVNSAPATVDLTVNPVNDVPAANAQALSTAQDTALAVTLSGSDVDGDALSFNVLTNPAYGSLSGTTPALTYTPAAGFIGVDSFTFEAFDGTLPSAPAEVSIHVTAPNHPPTADDQALETAEDAALPVTLSGSDPDGNPLSFSVLSQPAHGVLSGSVPSLSYTPAANYFGADSFSFKVNDGTLDSAPATVSLSVVPVNDAPLAAAQSLTTQQDTALAITLTGSDIEGDALSFMVMSGPSHGTLSGSAPALTYTPAAGYSGADSFSFKVNDGQLDSAEAVVSITVSPAGPFTVFSDDFETVKGWTRNPSGSDTATLGVWERANPAATSSSGTKQMGTTTSGSYDLVTGPLAGSSAGAYDIDGGTTTIRSPNITLPAGKTLTLTLRYYMAHLSNSSTSDYLRVKIVGSTISTIFQELGANNDDDAAWATLTYNLSAYAGQTVYVLIEAADASGASLVEAAVDDVQITAQ